MVKRTKPRPKLGSHLKNPVQKADEAFQITNLAFGTEQDCLNGVQEFNDFGLGEVQTTSTKFILQPMYSISTPS